MEFLYCLSMLDATDSLLVRANSYITKKQKSSGLGQIEKPDNFTKVDLY